MSKTEELVAEALRGQVPVKGLPGVSIQDVREQPEQPFDISFELLSGPNRILVLGEIKATFSPRLLEEIGPWIRRLKSLRADVSVAVIAPALSSQAQEFCIQNGIDFLDLAGNIFINVPGRFTLQRNGMRARSELASFENARSVNVFSGRFSRVLRVLLEKPTSWTVTSIARELESEGRRFAERYPVASVDFKISQGSISKAVTGLEEQLWVRRRGTSIIVPEPKRLLEQWAEKYKERYRWRLRSSFQTDRNPFGTELASLANGVGPLVSGPYAFTGAMATTIDAPFIDIDVIDTFVLRGLGSATGLRELKSQASSGPPIRVITPYDAGVLMYERNVGKAPIVSSVQAYLDLYARGGRDLKQAEYLLNNVIEARWRNE
jgi:hypothetical protein